MPPLWGFILIRSVLTEKMAINLSLRLLRCIVAVTLLTAWCCGPAWSATAQSKFYAADRCLTQLQKNPKQQKYRDHWLTCVRKYLAVYRHDPHGPWAAAGLYYAGTTYGELHKRSFLAEDRRDALELLDKVVRYFPDSRYKPRAQKAAAALRGDSSGSSASPAPSPKSAEKATAAADKAAIALKWYRKAQDNDLRLEHKQSLQKYRDQWLKSIDAYREAYQADPKGEMAPAALYGMANAYAGMYKWSRNQKDRVQSEKTLQALMTEFPQSSFAEKAGMASKTAPYPGKDQQAGDDGIAAVINDSADASSSLSSRDMPSAGATAVVDGLRFWSNPRYTRVVIDASNDTVFTYRQLREDPDLGKPQRIYVDVHNSRLSDQLQKVIPINDNLLSDARAGQYDAETVRVVVDIKSSKTYKIFSLKNPFRIVLDVWGEGSDQTVAAAPEAPQIHTSGKLPQSAIVKQLALGVRRIVIDPGHGGKDYGAPGAIRKVHEKNVVLDISRRLAEKIRAQLKCEVVMTRSKDVYLSLEERTAIANTQNADLFISIHTNASPDRRAYGMETYILNLATDDESIRVAARENATSTKNISDLDSILQDLMQNAKVSESTRLASYVQHSTYTRLNNKYSNVRNKGVKKAPFYVLLGADMPAILIETSFISNVRECRRLTNTTYQDHLCQGIVDGIKHYIEESNPMAHRQLVRGLKGEG